MSSVILTIEVPEALVERAGAVGFQLEEHSDRVIKALETEIARREAADEIRNIAARLHSLPDEVKPAPEDIEAEIRAYHDPG